MPDPTTVELIGRFMQAAVNAAATVDIIDAEAAAIDAAILSAAPGDGTIILSEPDDLDPSLFAIFKTNPRVVTDPSKEQFRHVAIGVTDAFCAVASTGSVCVTMSDHLTSAAGMLTRRHIVVVEASSILPRPSDVFIRMPGRRSGLERSFTFITGPSATADMGPLVRGVHGPGQVHIIIIADPDTVTAVKSLRRDETLVEVHDDAN